jgi:hypothetical protein
MKGEITMKISSAWLPEVHRGVQLTQHQHLFERRTPYLQSPLDGIQIVTNRSTTSEFLELAQRIGRRRYHYCNPRAAYRKSYSFGCVRVFMNPKWKDMHAVKIYINPSQGGLTVKQVFDWIKFIVGDVTDCWVKGVHYKIDIHGLNTTGCINKIWWPCYRKNPDYDRYKGRTVYFGTRTSKKQLVVYDKARQMDQRAILTRIELRVNNDKKDLLAVDDYFSRITEFNVFEDVSLIDAPEKLIDDWSQQFGRRKLDKCISRVLKSMTKYWRIKMLDHLTTEGYVQSLQPLYMQQLLRWLRVQEGELE